jgi:hypothetical protein
MRTILTVALVLTMAATLAGGLAAALTGPLWAAGVCGFAAAFAVPAALEAVADLWACRPA